MLHLISKGTNDHVFIHLILFLHSHPTFRNGQSDSCATWFSTTSQGRSTPGTQKRITPTGLRSTSCHSAPIAGKAPCCPRSRRKNIPWNSWGLFQFEKTFVSLFQAIGIKEQKNPPFFMCNGVLRTGFLHSDGSLFFSVSSGRLLR